MRMFIALSLVLVALLPGCCTAPSACTPLPTAYEDAKAEDEAAGVQTPCGRACSQLRTLGCSEGFQPKGGDTCYRTCSNDAATGAPSLPVQCVIKAKTVDAVRKCQGIACEKA